MIYQLKPFLSERPFTQFTYKIQNNFLRAWFRNRLPLFKTVIFHERTRQWRFTRVRGRFIWKCRVIQIGISDWPRLGQGPLISCPSIFLLRLKLDDVIIKLGRVARLGNGPSLRGHNRRNGGNIKQNDSRKQCGLRNAERRQHQIAACNMGNKTSLIQINTRRQMVWIILFQLNF